MKTVILASGSLTRQALLRAAGVPHRVEPPQVDESVWKKTLLAQGATPKAIALALAEAKAIARPAGPHNLVIGADQTLEIDGELFDKTNTLSEARARLLDLRGRAFALHSAVAGAEDGTVSWRYEESARLTVRAFSNQFLDDYLARNGDALATSLAGFALEGEGVQLFDHIAGDYFTILGLPLTPLLGWLRRAGGLTS